MPADVAVVIGNYAGEHVLPDCLESLVRQSQPAVELVVVDGGSSDRSREVAERYAARFLLRSNRGLGYLYNQGAAETEAPFVLFLNNDVALDERCIELLAAELAADGSAFAADPTQHDWTGARMIHARTLVTRGRMQREFIPGLHLDDNVAAAAVVPTLAAHGAAMLVRRSHFVELGGFDESFFMEWEDLDLCWRAWLRGWPSVYVPEAALRHRVGAVTTAAVAPRRSASSHHNLMRFALKCLPASAAARVLIGELLRLPAHPQAIGRAFVRLAAELREIARLRRALLSGGVQPPDSIAALNRAR